MNPPISGCPGCYAESEISGVIGIESQCQLLPWTLNLEGMANSDDIVATCGVGYPYPLASCVVAWRDLPFPLRSRGD